MKVWMARAGKWGEDEDAALESGLIIIGWREMPDLSSVTSEEALRELYQRTCPYSSKMKTANALGQLATFVFRMAVGDIVALPLKTRPQVALGRLRDGYSYRDVNGEMRHTRPVEWVRTDVPRSDFGKNLLFSLGAFLTVCRIQRNNAEQRFETIIKGGRDPALEEGPEEAALADVEQAAQDQIVGHVEEHFRGHDLARLVAAVLQAEGYTTRLSSPGPDGGVDILAGRGPLGFDGPRLCVQVKSSHSPADVTTLRALQGTMQTFQADQGLLVSWGGFTRAVDQEARQSFFTVRLWDSAVLVEAVLRTYDRFPAELQAELPLKRIWALVLEE